MKTNAKNDILKATGTPENGTTITPSATTESVIKRTTDKMGITHSGGIAKGFVWGLAISTIVWMGVAAYYKKLSINYAK
jgi:hypothetical protein